MNIRQFAGENRRRLVPFAIAAGIAVAMGVLVPIVMTSTAYAATELVIDSTDAGGTVTDADPGDGVCATSAGTCTLRAAIEESNALNAAPGEVTITVDESIVGEGLSDQRGTDYRMTTDRISSEDIGALYVVTAPVTLDLDHRFYVDSVQDDVENAAFYLNGPGITILNADLVRAGGSSFVVGPNASNVVIDGGGGEINTDSTYYPERFVTVMQGVTGLTVKNYNVRGFYDSAVSGGIMYFNNYPTSDTTPRSDIVFDGLNVNYASESTTCSASDGSGCRTRLTNFVPFTANNVTQGLTFQNMTVANMTNQRAFSFANSASYTGSTSVVLSDLKIVNNTFTNNQGFGTADDDAFITLPRGGQLTGTSEISGNTFVRAASGQGYAISYAAGRRANDSSMTDTTRGSGLTITDNYFNGYTNSSIWLRQTGLVTVQGNTFGTRSGSQGNPGTAEEYSDSTVLVGNVSGSGANYAANQSIRTWAPTDVASVPTGSIPASALAMTAATDQPVCTAIVDVQQITDTNNRTKAAGSPVTLDAFWTDSDTAEVYLGTVSGVAGTEATLALPLPIGAQTLADGTAQVVDAATGDVSGYVRLQTHVEGLDQLESSQYSRLVEVEGNCRPSLTLEQADEQNDPTLARDLHYTLTSSMSLEIDSVTVEDFLATATAVDETSDDTRLNPRVLSVTEVAGSDGMQWDIVVRVDDSALVELALPADAVTSSNGMTNADPAKSEDAAITFINPLVLDPGTMDVIAGEQYGEKFTLGTRAGAPTPGADLSFTSTVTQDDGTPTVKLSTSDLTIASGSTVTDSITVTADAGAVAAGTEALVSFTVASEDANYDGLVVPSLSVLLYATDPAIQITKNAYVDVTDTTDAASIVGTGTLAPTGSRLTDRQAVCFVYTVTNTSQDDWTTSITGITVTDSDERLGTDGVIGTIDTLARGESAQLASCTVLIPEDTTQSVTK
ncbi:right-handed parallel beta-helix repeat-containing protein [Microbacterium suaedae]|uniref:right-handed parallel beta-helix repeat-containing protein n=1 Tax=Microbacterium suaedae TaxID=2067813 RepID=UPI000DA1BBF5|nr:right-handed parallel beta-helix repeat-containing protein [Microbacterium suaedae]